MANGLIGNHSDNKRDISMGDLLGNAFTDITITMHGTYEENYLAGGGVIGLRATGEPTANTGSATMGDVTGNVFRDVKVTTDAVTNESAYIEGGGIIGVDAVSTPAVKQGVASIASLGNNLFTDIEVISNDIILGGGLVGVNNNSQRKNEDTYSELGGVSGNVFGNGTFTTSSQFDTADIYVKAGYSLRGGGVIGVNGLSNADVRLNSLTSNVFAGIYVDAGTYIKGGGIVGVQSNDGEIAKMNATPVGLEIVSTRLGNVDNNVFFNLRVDAGTYSGGTAYSGYLWGGGVIGVRSNEGLVTLDGLEYNIFKEIDINIDNATDPLGGALDGGGIIGASALRETTIQKVRYNYFDELGITTVSNLHGGGVVGASSTINGSTNDVAGVADVDLVVGNVFNNVEVGVSGNLSGGGIVGANNTVTNSSTGTSPYHAMIPTLTGNTFSGTMTVNVIGDIAGGGIVGAHTDFDGNNSNPLPKSAGTVVLSNNQFLSAEVSSTNLFGGGIVGFDASEGASAVIGTATGGTVWNNVFDAVTVVTTGSISGGGVIGANTADGLAGVANMSNNGFTSSVSVSSGANLGGGGIVGVNASVTGDAAITNVSGGNVFEGSTVATTGTGSILGGGIIGANTVGGVAMVEGVSNNFFRSSLQVTSAAGISGGGIIGAHTVDGMVDAGVQDGILNNRFTGVLVTSTASNLSGGGIIGVNASGTGGVLIGNVSGGNVFEGSTVATTGTGSIFGGGIIGAHTMGTDPLKSTAGIVEVSNNFFMSNLQVTSAGDLSGGGIIGVNGSVGVAIGNVSSNLFDASTVNITQSISGGGIVGANTLDYTANINGMSSNSFAGVQVSSASLSGGGVVGANASGSGYVVVGNVSNNSFGTSTAAPIVTISGDITGGGIVGANAVGGTANIIGMSNNHFTNNLQVSSTTGNLSGGGIVGASNTAGNAAITNVSNNFFDASATIATTNGINGGGIFGASATTGTANIGGMSNNTFSASSIVTLNSDITGGGVVGAYASDTGGSATIASMSDNYFYNTVNVTGDITGGGVVGVHSEGSTAGVASIGLLTGNWFYQAHVTASGSINGGGLVGVTGDAGSIGINRIDSSVFMNNSVTASGGSILGGAVYTNGADSEMTISDSRFTGNEFNASGTVFGTVVVDTKQNTSTNTLRLTATAGGSTYFEGNQITDSGTPRTNSLFFGATSGTAASDAELFVSPTAGGSVALYDPIEVDQSSSSNTFKMTVDGAGEFFWGGANTFTVDATHANNAVNFAPGSMTTLVSGMTLDAENHYFNQASGQINVMGLNQLTVYHADLHGHLHFNLNAPTLALNDVTTVLLKNNSSSANIDIEGATVSLSNFGKASDATLAPGSKFYLIDTDLAGYLTGNPANNIAYARQGLTRGYNFIIDKKGVSDNAADEQQLVARLLSAVPAHEARILTEGRSASLALLGQSADWLADHSYQQADLAFRRGENRGAFGGIDGSRIRANTGSHISMHGSMMLAGLATRRDSSDSSFLLGGYFEGGYADYSVRGNFGHPDHPRMKGKGDLRYYGVGLMARQRWDSGFRIEASARTGRLENKFHSNDLVDEDGITAKYKLHTSYFGAHVGVGYEHQVSEQSTLDFLLRYYWARQGGKSVTLDNGERVKFEGDDSQRARVGTRYTYAKDAWHSYYIGLAYEYEFDHRTRASSYGNDFGVPSMKGSSGVGEIGMILYPRADERLSIEAGFQGYTGKREGISGGVRVGWKF